MNSSTSISEPHPWRRALWRYAAFCLGFAIVLTAALVSLDPYDTGRFSVLDGYGVANFGPRFTAVSLAREPTLEAAILGNSTSEMLDPTRLTTLTGLRFVSLAIHGTGPVEELAVAHWLVRHHQGNDGERLKALVIGLDNSWCRGDGQLEPLNPFPFWLYSDSRLAYVTNLVNLKAFEAVERRVKLLLGREPPFRADGYRDYDADKVWSPAVVARHFAAGTEGFDEIGPGDFVAADRLGYFFHELPSETAILLLFVPRHHSSLSPPNSAVARYEEQCKQRFRDLAAHRNRTAVVDLLTDGPIAQEDRNFWDRIHYRAPVARLIEADIAEALRGLMQQAPQQAAGGG
jgi:hypothetical protein